MDKMILAIHGEMQSGKDTVGKMIQEINNGWEVKKFAGKLKDIVCLLLNCTRDDLEKEEFKNKELGKEWWKIKISAFDCRCAKFRIEYKDFLTNKECLDNDFIQYLEEQDHVQVKSEVIKLTPRLLLQLLGTECGRDIIHPQIWVNSTMNEYVDQNWLITDLRFPNEAVAVKKLGGKTITISRGEPTSNKSKHESEIALNNYDFDYRISNDGTLGELFVKVKYILQDLNLI